MSLTRFFNNKLFLYSDDKMWNRNSPSTGNIIYIKSPSFTFTFKNDAALEDAFIPAFSGDGWGSGVDSVWAPQIGFPVSATGSAIYAEAVKVIDNSSSNLGCDDSPSNSYLNKIAIIQRGDCQFGTKALKAEQAGAVAVIIFNLENNPFLLGAGVDGSSVNIPVVSIAYDKGQMILNALDNSETVEIIYGYYNP